MTLNALPPWATNVNYSTGPDAGTPTKVDPSSAPNGFIAGVIAAPQHVNFLLNALAGEVPKALDGQDGGTYALQSDLEIDGPAALVILGEMEVAASAVVSLLANSALLVKQNADVTIENGGDLHVANGGDINVDSGGEVNVASGGLINVASGASILAVAGSLIRVATPAGLTINNGSVIFRVTMTPVMIAESVGDPVWKGEIQGTWYAHLVSITDGYIVFALPLRVGDLLTTLRCTFDGGTALGHTGGSGLAPGTPQVFELFETDLDGTPAVIAAAFDAIPMPAYDNPHSVTMSGGALPYTVTANPLYVRVKAEGGANAVPGTTRLCSIDGTLTARSFRGANEFY